MNATERGCNPYGDTIAPSHSKPMIDDRANGLDGDVLDQLLKGRWQEGYQVGQADGHRAAANNWAGIYDDGFSAGCSTGISEETARFGSVALPLLNSIGADLLVIAGKTSSADITRLCNERVAEIKTLLDQEVGRYQEQQNAERSDL